MLSNIKDCLEQLQVYAGLGVTFFMLYFVDLPSTEGLRLFAETVAKKMQLKGRRGQYAPVRE